MGLGREWPLEAVLELLHDYDRDHRPLDVWHPTARPDAAQAQEPSAVHKDAVDLSMLSA